MVNNLKKLLLQLTKPLATLGSVAALGGETLPYLLHGLLLLPLVVRPVPVFQLALLPPLVGGGTAGLGLQLRPLASRHSLQQVSQGRRLEKLGKDPRTLTVPGAL